MTPTQKGLTAVGKQNRLSSENLPFWVKFGKLCEITFLRFSGSVDAKMGSSTEDWSFDDDEEAFLDSEEPADAIAVRNGAPKFWPNRPIISNLDFALSSSPGRPSRRKLKSSQRSGTCYRVLIASMLG